MIFANKKRRYKKMKVTVKLEEGESKEIEIELRKTTKRIKGITAGRGYSITETTDPRFHEDKCQIARIKQVTEVTADTENRKKPRGWEIVKMRSWEVPLKR